LKNPIKISVIIPSYNRFKYLLNAIESVMNQTYSNIEIIVVNDGSTQKEYYEHDFPSKVQKIDLETNQKNIIGYVSEGYIRNFGIKAASGKYLAFLDDDDIWTPKKLEIQLNKLLDSGSKFSSTEGFFGKGIYDNSKDYPLYNAEYFFKKISKKYIGTSYKPRSINNLFKNTFQYPETWSYDFLKHHNCVVASSVMVEKEIMEIVGGFRGIPTSMRTDYDCWLSLLKVTDLEYINEPLFYYDGGHGDGQDWR
jgi:glycosyltransferase involved in cell wall biosynthesis|tara:strand:- start:3563 stop:4318 length:756 start_codon:yes stop_codon:yes gene_type:complete